MLRRLWHRLFPPISTAETNITADTKRDGMFSREALLLIKPTGDVTTTTDADPYPPGWRITRDD